MPSLGFWASVICPDLPSSDLPSSDLLRVGRGLGLGLGGEHEAGEELAQRGGFTWLG